jgi:Tfp pilus assembly protein PilX
MMTDTQRTNDSGAVLILALLFVLVVGLVGGALITFAGSSLAQTSSLGTDRSKSYGAESAINVAIDQLRTASHQASNTVGYQAPVSCPTTTVTVPGYAAAFKVMCVIGQASLPFQRNIMFAACPSTSNCLSGQGTFTPAVGSTAIVSTSALFHDLAKDCSVHTDGQDQCFVAGDSVDVSGWDQGEANS